MKKMNPAVAALMTTALALTACGTAASQSPAAESIAPTPVVDATPLPDDILNLPVTVPEGGGVSDDMGVNPGTEMEPDTELAGMVEELYAAHPVELMMLRTGAIDLTNPDWAKYNAGLDEETAAKADAAVLSESMTGSQAYSLVLVRVKDKADAEAVADAMLENIDMRKWICVMADKARVVTFDDKVLYVTAAADLTDVDALVDAAATTFGVTFDTDSSRTLDDGGSAVAAN